MGSVTSKGQKHAEKAFDAAKKDVMHEANDYKRDMMGAARNEANSALSTANGHLGGLQATGNNMMNNMKGMCKDKIDNTKVVLFVDDSAASDKASKILGTYFLDDNDFDTIHVDKWSSAEGILDSLDKFGGTKKIPQLYIKGDYVGGLKEIDKLHADDMLSEKFKKAGADVFKK